MDKRTRKAVALGAIAATIMFSFSFAMSPLYRVVCKVTGLNGGASVEEVQETAGAKNLQQILVQFVATNNANLPWDFYPKTNSLTVSPDHTMKVEFYAKNNSKHTMTVQAVPSFTPAVTAKYFHKIECFCFTQQTLAPGESKDMAVVFRIDNAFPSDIHTLTLAYTLFDLTKQGKHA